VTDVSNVILSAADRADLLEAVAYIGNAGDLDDFANRACRRLFELVPGISTSYNEINLLSERFAAVVWPDPGADWYARYAPVFQRYMYQNPLLRHINETGEGDPVSWLDVDPTRSFERTELYTNFYLPNGIRSQIAFSFPAPPGISVGMAVNRDGEQFSPRERRLMSELRVHLVNVYRLVSQVEAGRVPSATLAAQGWTVVLVSDTGEVLSSNRTAIQLGKAVGLDLQEDATLRGTEVWQRLTAKSPEALWSVRRPPTPVLVTGPGVHLEMVLARTPVGPHPIWLRQPSPVTVESVRRLGLTDRQAEVALLLLDGATNRQIGLALNISPGTVRKHLESVFATLGVNSRAAAAVALLGRARPVG
jgi:DNA-binding CsgD family transcriptional regulator